VALKVPSRHSLPRCVPAPTACPRRPSRVAAHHAYDNHLADAVGKVGGIGATFTSTTLGFVISSVAGLSTMGIAGPAEALTSAAVGTTAGAVIDVRKIIRRRKSSGWVAVHQLLDDL
jgi:hypothetical protein